MTVVPNRVTVSTTATRLDTTTEADYAVGSAAFAKTYGQSTLIWNRGTVSVFLGGPSVTASTGFELTPDASLPVDLSGNDTLYGITASGTAPCHVLQTGV